MQVIKFSATWCAPCKMLAPTFDELSKMEDFKEVEFRSIDIEEDHEDLTAKYQIKSVPTIVIVGDDNEVKKKIVGNLPKSSILEIFNEELK